MLKVRATLLVPDSETSAKTLSTKNIHIERFSFWIYLFLSLIMILQLSTQFKLHPNFIKNGKQYAVIIDIRHYHDLVMHASQHI